MKRFLIVLALIMISVSAGAQSVSFEKKTFVANQTGVFNLSQTSATNTRTGVTLLVWQRNSGTTTSIVSRLIGPAGNPIAPVSTLVAGPGVAHPSVAYNPANNEFLLAYDNNPSFVLVHSNILVQRLTPLGRISGSPVTITTDTVSAAMTNILPRVFYNPANSGYTVFWIREAINPTQVTEGNNGMVGGVLANAVATPASVQMIRRTVDENNTLWEPLLLDAVYHSVSGQLLLTYAQVITGTGGDKANYYLGRLDPMLRNIANSNFVKINPKQVTIERNFPWNARLGFQSAGPGYVIYVDSSNLKRRRIDAAGNLLSGVTTAFRSPRNNTELFFPALAVVNGPAGERGLMIAVEHAFSIFGKAVVWAQVLDPNGIPLGEPVKLDTTADTSTALDLSIVALPARQNMAPYRFAGFYSHTTFQAADQAFLSAGLVQLKLAIQP